MCIYTNIYIGFNISCVAQAPPAPFGWAGCLSLGKRKRLQIGTSSSYSSLKKQLGKPWYIYNILLYIIIMIVNVSSVYILCHYENYSYIYIYHKPWFFQVRNVIKCSSMFILSLVIALLTFQDYASEYTGLPWFTLLGHVPYKVVLPSYVWCVYLIIDVSTINPSVNLATLKQSKIAYWNN